MTADAVGGVWTYALDLARGLAPLGVETTLLVNGPPPAEPPEDVAMVATGLPLDWLAERPEEVTGAGARLAELAGDLRADVVQLNSPAYGAGARFPAPVVGVQHSCTATWWRAVRGDAPWPDDFGWRFDLARRGLLACASTVAPTRAFAAAVEAEYALPFAPHAVWNGRRAHGSSAAARRGSGWETGEPYVFTAGRLWDESKGMAVLDAAAQGLPVPVVAAGPLASPGGDPAAFAHLRTPGVLAAAELQARLAGAAAFCSPSLYEPFGLAVLEAAQAARPLVLSDIATFRELWDGAAAFVPPRAPAALRDALCDLLHDGERRAALGVAAAERARRYTVEAMAAGMMDVFAGLQLGRS